VVVYSVYSKRIVGLRAAWLLVGCDTLQGRCVCVFGVKLNDLYGSDCFVARWADWHSDAGGK
jgi:hypothetical protein